MRAVAHTVTIIIASLGASAITCVAFRTSNRSFCLAVVRSVACTIDRAVVSIVFLTDVYILVPAVTHTVASPVRTVGRAVTRVAHAATCAVASVDDSALTRGVFRAIIWPICLAVSPSVVCATPCAVMRAAVQAIEQSVVNAATTGSAHAVARRRRGVSGIFCAITCVVSGANASADTSPTPRDIVRTCAAYEYCCLLYWPGV